MSTKQIPPPFSFNRIKSIVEGSRGIRMDFSDASKTNIESTSSFYYDPPESGIKSTQQLNVDWSNFRNHTFFNSAEVNVNVAFDKIINGYPFDGTKKEIESFFEKLSGFEKWIFDNFPKNVGYLFFSGTQIGEDTDGTRGTFISVLDNAGALYPELSKQSTGNPVLNPGNKSFSAEFYVYLPAVTNNKQVVFQKLSGSNQGFTFHIENTSSTSTAVGTFSIVSGSTFLSASLNLTKGAFNHLCLTYNRDIRLPRLEIYQNSSLVSYTTKNVEFGAFDFGSSLFNIGSGSAFSLGGTTITPQTTFSGALDEFRFFHAVRTPQQQQQYANKNVYADEDLKLYFKFNEPTGSLGPSGADINRVVLDSSGNSLHALISNAGFNYSLRSTGSISVPLLYEHSDLSPILFAYHPDVVSLNTELLTSASEYDDANPNLITRLIPQHYLQEGKLFEGLETSQGTIGDAYSGQGAPGTGQLGSVQLLLSFLYVWGKFFDEIKLFIDSFGKVNFVDYDSTDTAPDAVLPYLFKWLGFDVPPIFVDSSVEQYIDAENIDFEYSRGAEPLKSVQNQMLRRVLVSLRDVMKSKGTQRSVKSFMRSLGFDPDNSFRIREFGGPTDRPLSYSRENKLEPSSLLNVTQSCVVTSPYLSGGHYEVGFPAAAGTMTLKSTNGPHGISSSPSDGLFTSGSWTFEAIYKLPLFKKLTANTQSLARMAVSGTNSSLGGTTFNLIALSSSAEPSGYKTGKVILIGRPGSGDTTSTSPFFELVVPADIYDGKKWNISFGRRRGDEFGESAVSSSYYLYAARQEYGDVRETYSNSTWVKEIGTAGSASMNSLQNIDSSYNAFGSFIIFGSASLPVGSTSGYKYLNNISTITGSHARATKYEGQISQLRFWTKSFKNEEWLEHVRNYKSLGVQNPLTNFNFGRAASGSWGKLRMDVSMRQQITSTDALGNLSLFDYSQNGLNLSATGLPSSSNVFSSDLFNYSMISPYFDEGVTNEKVRVRSYQNLRKTNSVAWAETAPVYRINPSESPSDDTRFSIEFSIIDALNRDIINIFSTLDSLDNILGNPELLYSPDYPGLENLRNIYFNRLTDKVNFKSFFEFFRWFETSIGSFIEQLIPRKTKFYGTNFVIESHMLERNKFSYQANEMFLSDAKKTARTEILLEQLSSQAKKY